MSEIFQYYIKAAIYNWIGFVLGAFVWDKKSWLITILSIAIILYIFKIFLLLGLLILLLGFSIMVYFVPAFLSLFGLTNVSPDYWVEVTGKSIISSLGLSFIAIIIFFIVKWDSVILITSVINLIYGIMVAKNLK